MALPYRELSENDYAERAARTFMPSTPAPGMLLLTGPCPRCAATIDIAVVEGVYKTFRLRRRAAAGPPPAPAERIEPVVCTCTEEHTGRPANRTGCGAFWLLKITVKP